MAVKSTTLSKLSRIIGAFQTLNPEIPSQFIQIILEVARGGSEGVTQREIVTRTGLSRSTVSRTCLLLSKEFRAGTPGWNVVTVEIDPMDRRNRIVKLTPKGRQAVLSAASQLES